MVREAKLGEKKQSPKKKKKKSNNAKDVERLCKTQKNASYLSPDELSSESAAESSEEMEMELVTQLGTFSTSDLGGLHCHVKSKSKKKASGPPAKKGNESKGKKTSSSKSNEVNKGRYSIVGRHTTILCFA